MKNYTFYLDRGFKTLVFPEDLSQYEISSSSPRALRFLVFKNALYLEHSPGLLTERDGIPYLTFKKDKYVYYLYIVNDSSREVDDFYNVLNTNTSETYSYYSDVNISTSGSMATLTFTSTSNTNDGILLVNGEDLYTTSYFTINPYNISRFHVIWTSDSKGNRKSKVFTFDPSIIGTSERGYYYNVSLTQNGNVITLNYYYTPGNPAGSISWIGKDAKTYTIKENTTIEVYYTNSSSDTGMSGHYSLYFKYVEPEVTTVDISFPDTIENGTVTGSGTYPIGTSVTVTASANSGYKFDGWYVNGKLLSDKLSYTFNANDSITLVPKFSKIVYSVTLGTHSNGSIEILNGVTTISSGSTVNPNTVLTFTATANSGYDFTQWNYQFEGETSQTNITNPLNLPITNNLTVGATFTKLTTYYTITLESTSNGTISVKNGSTTINNKDSIAAGTTLTLSATPDSGYKLDHWVVNGKSQTSNTVTVTGATTISAVFVEDSPASGYVVYVGQVQASWSQWDAMTKEQLIENATPYTVSSTKNIDFPATKSCFYFLYPTDYVECTKFQFVNQSGILNNLLDGNLYNISGIYDTYSCLGYRSTAVASDNSLTYNITLKVK